MKKPVAVFLVLVLMSVGSAGCMDGDPEGDDPVPDEGDDWIDLPSEDDDPTFQRYTPKVAGLIVIKEAAENRTVDIHRMGSNDELDDCRMLLDGIGGVAWFHYVVWNRTGVADYHEFPVSYGDLNQPFSLSLELPDDPPYILQTIFCEPNVPLIVDFHAHDFFFAVQGRSEISGVKYGLITERDRLYYDVEIPMGETQGAATFTLEGDLYFLETPPAVDSVAGHPYGEYFLYEPGESGENWTIKGEFNAVQHDRWWSRLVHHAKPGTYEFRVNLSTPAPVDTVWESWHHVYRFTENITNHGFEHPLRRYV